MVECSALGLRCSCLRSSASRCWWLLVVMCPAPGARPVPPPVVGGRATAWRAPRRSGAGRGAPLWRARGRPRWHHIVPAHARGLCPPSRGGGPLVGVPSRGSAAAVFGSARLPAGFAPCGRSGRSCASACVWRACRLCGSPPRTPRWGENSLHYF